MKFEKVTHYMIDKDDGLPWFKILMSGGKSYISVGLEFVEDTPQNRQYLINKYNCEYYLKELDNSPIDNHDNIKDASYMMSGCKELKDFELTASNLIYASFMMNTCNNLVNFKLVAPNLKHTDFMMYRCDNVVNFKLVAPKLIKTRYMMNSCINLVNFELIAPNLKDDYEMINGCDNIENFELEAPLHIMEKYKHLLKKKVKR